MTSRLFHCLLCNLPSQYSEWNKWFRYSLRNHVSLRKQSQYHARIQFHWLFDAIQDCEQDGCERKGMTDIDIDIYVNCIWVDTRWQQYSTHLVATRWQQYSTHLHTNSTQNITINNKTTRITNKTTQTTNLEECWPCPVFANYTLAFTLQPREKHGKTSVRVAEEIWLSGNSSNFFPPVFLTWIPPIT
jgi:hypothetical protein